MTLAQGRLKRHWRTRMEVQTFPLVYSLILKQSYRLSLMKNVNAAKFQERAQTLERNRTTFVGGECSHHCAIPALIYPITLTHCHEFFFFLRETELCSGFRHHPLALIWSRAVINSHVFAKNTSPVRLLVSPKRNLSQTRLIVFFQSKTDPLATQTGAVSLFSVDHFVMRIGDPFVRSLKSDILTEHQ